MLQTIEAVTNERGELKILEHVTLPKSRRVLITILNEEFEDNADLASLSEASLAQDWLQAEEDKAWSNLARLPSL
jgi:hypothetical protein